MQLIANGTQGPTSLPTKQTPSGTPGYANSGPPGTFAATNADPDIFNTVLSEIASVVLASGAALDPANNAQLLAAIQTLVGPGRLLNIRRFTSSGTYTPTAGTNSVDVICVGGGAAGGGAPATGASQLSVGSGGASGSIGRGRYTSGFSGVTMTVGAAGAAASGTTGGSGGTTSFGSLLTAPGGTGGGVIIAATGSVVFAGQGGPGAAASGSGILVANAGQPGPNGLILPTAAMSGQGAPSPLGGGGGTNTSAGVGGAGSAPGAGGAGSANGVSSSALLGGAGAAGMIIVAEFS